MLQVHTHYTSCRRRREPLLPFIQPFWIKYKNNCMVFLTDSGVIISATFDVVHIISNYNRKHHTHEILALNTRISHRTTQVSNAITIFKITNEESSRPKQNLIINYVSMIILSGENIQNEYRVNKSSDCRRGLNRYSIFVNCVCKSNYDIKHRYTNILMLYEFFYFDFLEIR